MRQFVKVVALVVLVGSPVLAQTAPPAAPAEARAWTLAERAFAQTAPPAAPTSAPTPQGQQPPPAAPAQGRGAVAPAAQAAGRGGRGGLALGGIAASQDIKLDLMFTDTQGSTRKTVSMLVLDRASGQVRSTSPEGRGEINVDAEPTLIEPIRPGESQRIYLRLTVQYFPELSGQLSGRESAGSLNESLTVVVFDGKSMVLSQAADPKTDRKVTLEVLATVIR